MQIEFHLVQIEFHLVHEFHLVQIEIHLVQIDMEKVNKVPLSA